MFINDVYNPLKKLDSFLKLEFKHMEFINYCMRGNIRMVKKYLSHGADINTKDPMTGQPIFHSLCRKGDLRMIQFLLKNGANLNDRNKAGYYPLHYAFYHPSNLEVVKLLIKYNVDINCQDGNGWTIVRQAVNNCDIEMLQFLIKAGADINRADKIGTTPLHVATKNIDIEITQILLAAKADTKLKNKNGCVALNLMPVYQLKRKMVQLFIDAGADLNTKDFLGKTILYYACEHNQVNIVRALIEGGANVNICRPLFIACQKISTMFPLPRNILLCQMLLDAGAKIDIVDISGRTPLMYAFLDECSEIAELLISRGANIWISDKNGNTAIHYAAERKKYRLIELYLSMNI